jgi:hypothetical protein
MFKIVLKSGKLVFWNERIIMKIEENEDGTYTLEHFNNSRVIIKSFTKL